MTTEMPVSYIYIFTFEFLKIILRYITDSILYKIDSLNDPFLYFLGKYLSDNYLISWQIISSIFEVKILNNHFYNALIKIIDSRNFKKHLPKGIVRKKEKNV